MQERMCIEMQPRKMSYEIMHYSKFYMKQCVQQSIGLNSGNHYVTEKCRDNIHATFEITPIYADEIYTIENNETMRSSNKQEQTKSS